MSNRLLIAGFVVVGLAAGASAGELEWLPIEASGGHTIAGNEIVLMGGDQIVTVEVRVSGWDPDGDGDPTLGAFQVTLDPSGYSNGIGASLSPLTDRTCTVAADCDTGGCGNIDPGICDDPHPSEGGFQIINLCSADGTPCTFAPDDCPPDGPYAGGNFCITNPALPFSSLQSGVSTSTLAYEYLGASSGGCKADDGGSYYCGTLIIVVPTGAKGTYTIGFDEDPEATGLRDCNSFPLGSVQLTPIVISIACQEPIDCDDGNECTLDLCDPGTNTCSNDLNFDDTVYCCNPATGDVNLLTDSNGCTEDVCKADGSVTHPPESDGRPCGDSTNSECNNPDTCNGAGGCEANYELPGAACGTSADSDCDWADSCDGGGACLDNIQPWDAPCGDPTDNTCTDRDTCDGFGECLVNHAPDGAPCNSGQFCVVGEMCAAGVCGGEDPRDCSDGLDCTNDTCDESNDVCENVLQSGHCLIADVCYVNAALNPADDCYACDTSQTTGAWVLRPEGSPCDDGNSCTGTGRVGIDPDTCDAVGVCAGEEDPECNDECAFAIAASEGITLSNNENRGPDDGEASCQPDSNNDVWFSYHATCDGELFISTSGSTFVPSNDPVLSVYDGCPDQGGNEIACDDDSGIDLQAALTFITTAGADYLIRVAGFEQHSGDVVLNISPVDDCVIDNVCYAENDLNPLNECLACVPSVSAMEWSPRLEGTFCGNPSDTECDSPDACDGAGVCESNPKPDGTECSDDDNECTLDECLGGTCTHPPRPEGTACGEPADTECDDPDTCNLVGTCEPNHKPRGLDCGDPGSDQCNDPDTCDGAGLCDDNLKPVGTPCNDDDICTEDDICSEGVCAGTPIPEQPLVHQMGPKAIAVTPQPVGSVAPVALHVTSPDWACLDKYLGGIYRCDGVGKRCTTTANCNLCDAGRDPCLVDADCALTDDTCVVSGQTCLSGEVEPVDINEDGFPDGMEAALVHDPADKAVLTPDQWGTSATVCSRSLAQCAVDTDCDYGVCVHEVCDDGICEELRLCSVTAQDCPLFCSISFGVCGTDADCTLPGETCATATCALDEVCTPGKVYVVGLDIIPSTTYEVRAECDLFTSPAGSGATCLWADIDCDGFVNATDVQLVLLAFHHRFIVPLEAADIAPCRPNKKINATDLQRVLLAINGQTYTELCPEPCQ